MKTMTAIKDLLARAIGAGRDLVSAHRTLLETHARVVAERAALIASPAPKAEIIAAIREEVARRGEHWLAGVRAELPRVVGFDVSMAGTPTPRPPRLPNAFDGGLVSFDMLCALASEAVVASVTAAVETTAYTPGPPMAGRLDRIREYDDELARVEIEHTQLADEAGALEPPISLPLLEPVRARRAVQQQRAEWEAREARDRARPVRA